MEPQTKYWFRAKRFGWGWGLPLTWQGWLVLAIFLVMVAAGATLIQPRIHLSLFVIYVAILSGALMVVCWIKGEPPRWRWGGD